MMNLMKLITCVWLFYVLNGIILVGLVKVKVQSTIREKNEVKQDHKFKRDITQTGLWSGTISERIFIRKNVIKMNLSKQLFPRRTVLVNRISVRRGTVYTVIFLPINAVFNCNIYHDI